MQIKGVQRPIEWVMKNVPRMVSGDDVIAAIPDELADKLTPADVEEAARRMGFFVTSASVHKTPHLGTKYDTFETAMTVKRSFRFERNLVFMPLAKESLLGNLAWQREKGDPRQLCVSAMQSALNEAFLHGYDFYHEISQEFARIAALHNLELGIPTYEYLMGSYVH
jgi:hypothetical protein